MRKIYLTLLTLVCFAVTTPQVFSQATRPRPPQRYDYAGHKWNTGYLDCKDFRINWTKTSAPRFDKAIQVEGASDQFIIYEWTKPYYHPTTAEIRMDLEARLLRGPESGFLRVQATSAAGSTLASAQVGTFNGVFGGRAGAGTVRVNPINFGNPDTYKIVMSFSNGGSCSQPWLGEYSFFKVVVKP